MNRSVNRYLGGSNNSSTVHKHLLTDHRQNLNHVVDHSALKEIDPYAIELFKTGKIPNLSHVDDHAEESKEFSRLITDDTPREPYTRRTKEFKRVLHWGQLKLMLTEIEFLTLVMAQKTEQKDERPVYMIYAGAAPGHHTKYLHKLFPMVHFELYDPNDFAIKETDNIRLHVQFFTDSDAKQWTTEKSDKYIVFCSDIRTEPATEEAVKENMQMQLDWWKIMQPELAMFKFRLPWTTDGNTEYPEGEIYIQPFPGPTSTETRLIVKKGASLKNYSHKQYEEQLFYHNNIARKKKYNSIGDLNLHKDLVDNCYDCASFVEIVKRYLQVVGQPDQYKNIIDLVKEIQNEITFGKHNIYNQTITSFNQILDMLYALCFKKCNKVHCSLCKNRTLGPKWEGKSKATKENFEKAKKIAGSVVDILDKSETGTCESDKHVQFIDDGDIYDIHV